MVVVSEDVELVAHFVHFVRQAFVFLQDVAIFHLLLAAIVHGLSQAEGEESRAFFGVFDGVSRSDETSATVAGPALDGHDGLFQKFVVYRRADAVVSAGGAPVDAVAARLADTGLAFTKISDGVVVDFGHVGTAYDAIRVGGFHGKTCNGVNVRREVEKRQIERV